MDNKRLEIYKNIKVYIIDQINKEIDSKKLEVIGIDIVDVNDKGDIFDEFLLHHNADKYLNFLYSRYFDKNKPSLLFDRKNYRYFSLSNVECQFKLENLTKENLTVKENIKVNYREEFDTYDDGDFQLFWDEWINICIECLPKFNKIYYAKQKIAKTNYSAAIFIYLKYELEPFKSTKDHIFRILTNYLHHRISTKILPEQIKEIKKKSLQSSLSSVMSRNQSHNIGSHVLNNLSNKTKVGSFLDNGFNSFYKTDHKNRRYLLSGSQNNGGLPSFYINENDLNPEELIVSFNSYLKSRMDFIADISTSDKPALYNATYLFQDVFALFEKNLLLLREISGKENNFRYSFSLKLNKKEDKKGPFVSMPNALLGQQAFYILLENIIRNTAKHEVVTNENVIFHMDCTNQSKDSITRNFTRVIIYSDIGYMENDLKELVYDRNKTINENILTKNNTVRDRSWGTIEMKVAAAYLSGVNLTEIEDDKFKIILNKENNIDKNPTKYFPIIEAISVKGDGNLYYFGYQFYLKKPKLALVICNSGNYSVLIKSIGDFDGIDITSKTIDQLDSKTYTHDFLVFVGEGFKKIDPNLKNLPQRVLFFENPNDLKEVNEIEDFLWQKYYDQNLKNKTQGTLIAGVGGFNIVSKKSAKKYLFNRHGSLISDINNMEFFEPHSSSSLIGYLLHNQKFKHNNTLLNKCIEAALTKILIVDERVQSALNYTYKTESKEDNTGIDIEFRTIFKKTGIIVPEISTINLNKKDMKTNENLESLMYYIEEHIKKCDFFVLHFGILEMLKKLDNNILNQIKQMNGNCRIILISGRGRTKDIPINEHFINQSSFSYYLTSSFGRSKLHLTQLLKATR